MANTGKSKTDNYQVGQVWTYQTRQGEESSRLIIVRTTSKPGIGKVYSIFIENIQLDVGDGEIQEQLPHAPVSKEVLDASVLEMVETRQRLPDFEWAWQEWFDAGGGVYSIPVARILNTTEQAVATANDPYPVINWEKVAGDSGLERQLSLELSEDHVLFGVPFKVIARSCYSDGILVALPESAKPAGAQIAMVHLTWSGSEQRPPFPATELFANFQVWFEKMCVARSTPVSKQASAEQSPLASRPHKKYFFGLTPTTWILLVAMIGILALGLSLLGG